MLETCYDEEIPHNRFLTYLREHCNNLRNEHRVFLIVYDNRRFCEVRNEKNADKSSK